MDINEIIEEEGQAPESKLKPKRKIDKKVFLIIPLVVLILGAAGYFYLHKSTPVSSLITGPAGQGVFPPVSPNQFINSISGSKAQNKAVKAPLKRSVKNNAVVLKTPVTKSKSAVKAKKPDNTLDDLFTVKYKRKAKKTNMPVSPNMPPANVPAIPFNQSLPNFNLKNMAAKINNMQGISAGSSFNVSGYSGGYVIAECGKNTKYLKAGQSACGYTLLKANSDDATFSHNGKFKKISY